MDRNCCTVKALSAALEVSTETVREKMEISLGRRMGEGVPSLVWLEFLHENFVPVFVKGNLGRVIEVLSLNRSHSYIVTVKGHTLAVVFGQLHDSAQTNPNMRVISIYRVK